MRDPSRPTTCSWRLNLYSSSMSTALTRCRSREEMGRTTSGAGAAKRALRTSSALVAPDSRASRGAGPVVALPVSWPCRWPGTRR
jgi:hypothetical protein